MDYCGIIYHLPRSTSTFDCPINLNFMMQSLESTQYQAALAVSGAWKGSSTTKLYEELGWETLSDRRWLRRLCQFYKIQNDLTPSYLKKPIPQPRMFLYGQRRENVLHEIPCRTSRFLNSFYPDTIRSWNNIGYEFRNCSSQNYSTSTVPPKSQYLLYMTLVVLNFYFNLGLAIVQSKAIRKIITFWTLHRQYMTVEVVRKIPTIRTNLMISLSNILTHNNLEHLSHAELAQLYLCGQSNLGKTLNCLVLQASIKYIHDTKRFTQPHAHIHHLSLFVLSFIIPTGYVTRFWHPGGFRPVLCFLSVHVCNCIYVCNLLF